MLCCQGHNLPFHLMLFILSQGDHVSTHLEEEYPEGTSKHKNNKHGSGKVIEQLNYQIKDGLQRAVE